MAIYSVECIIFTSKCTDMSAVFVLSS